jgi:hypothetical protein
MNQDQMAGKNSVKVYDIEVNYNRSLDPVTTCARTDAPSNIAPITDRNSTEVRRKHSAHRDHMTLACAGGCKWVWRRTVSV